MHTSSDKAICEPGLEVRRALGHAGRFDELLAAHELAWKHLWEDCDLVPDVHCRQLCETIGLAPGEIERWREIGCKLRVPFHGEGIISQFDGYDELALLFEQLGYPFDPRTIPKIIDYYDARSAPRRGLISRSAA